MNEVNPMSGWIGRKKLAFVPVYRPHVPPPDLPDQIPADWPNDILRRVLFDPPPGTGADRSLRAFIHAASSGRADLDAVVMPMETLDQKDVPVEALDGKLGAQLKGQGFDAAALVMLGQPPTGTSQRGGFWARFDQSEGVGVWAMEFMHCLTGFDDLYPFGGNMGSFDEMACSCATHPSAYTKTAIGWLDASAIAQHIVPNAKYDLHAVGLVQPPPSGRSTAVRIGSTVPYLMIEARQIVDQFDAKIPNQGVIVYRIQTTDPLGCAQAGIAPVELLTTTALTVGQTFTSDSQIKVKVIAALPGGFSITVDAPPSGHRASGFVTSYEAERLNPGQPAGATNPLLQTLEIDATPGFSYTASGGPVYAAVVKKAQDTHRKVEIAYTPVGSQSGKIISVKLK
jgi:hypothetical protein